MKQAWKKYLLYGSVIVIGGTLLFILEETIRLTGIKTTQEYVTLIKDILTGLAALTAAVLGIVGLQTWKKQLRGKTEYELAQRFLRATYKVRDAIAIIRDVTSFVDMRRLANAALFDEQPDKPTTNKEEVATAYYQKWQTIQSIVVDLDAVALEGEAIWGEVVAKNMKPLRRCLSILDRHAKLYVSLAEHPAENARYQKLIESTERTIFDWDGPFGEEISAAIKQIEDLLKPYLKI
jgi:hypothetical protein